jgi:cytoskeletal protein CcmA (bactofilin family)|tara:strand:+ start:158 stop:583 length:426 start_codon:yes stop_codon:yes gene_type:complete
VSEYDKEFEFYVGPATHLEGASLAIDGTARIDGKIVGKVSVKHLIVGVDGVVQGDISGETATIEGTVEDTLSLTGKLLVCASGRIRGKIQYGSIQTEEGAKLIGEITTDWDQGTAAPEVSSRLEAFKSGLTMDADSEQLEI